MTDEIRVLIADDHLHEREGFKNLLSLVEGIRVVGEASSASTLAARVNHLRPDVVMLDLAWYGDESAGTAAIQQLKSVNPNVKVLAISNFRHLIEPARLAGADVAVVKDVLVDSTILAERIRDAYQSGDTRPPQPQKELLTEREWEVLKLLAEGLGDKQIKAELHISEATVKKHVSNIIAKFGASSRTGAVSEAFKRGFLPAKPRG